MASLHCLHLSASECMYQPYYIYYKTLNLDNSAISYFQAELLFNSLFLYYPKRFLRNYTRY